MPLIPLNGSQLFVEDTGGNGPAVVFSHGLLWSARLFHHQVKALSGRYRCIAYDHRGQGRSDVPKTRAIDIETVYEDALALIERLRIQPCHFVGLSMGGFVGMRIAARRPELLRSLTLLETSADPEPPENIPRYRLLTAASRVIGLSVVTAPVMKIMFGKTFLTDPARAAEREEWRAELKKNQRTIYRAVNGVIERKPILDELGDIRCPTLIMVGDEDVATKPAKAERIHQAIPGSRLLRIPNAGHSSTVEQPELVNRALLEFLASSPLP